MVAYSFKERFVSPIRVGLGLAPTMTEFAAGMDEFGNVHRPKPKRQTIRANGRRRHARPGDALQLYCGMRTKQCFKIGDARCTEVLPIEIDVRKTVMCVKINRVLLSWGEIDVLGRSDGFDGAEDMHAFWKAEHGKGTFKGVLIRWEPVQGEGKS